MTAYLSTMDMRQHLGEVLDRVALRNDEYVIERKGKALAVLMPVAKAAALERAARLRLQRLQERSGADLPDAELERLTVSAKHASRGD